MDDKNLNQTGQNITDHNVEVPNEIKIFLEGILEEAGFNGENEIKEQMIVELVKRLDAYTISRLVDSLPDNKVEGFLELMDKDADKGTIEIFIKESLDNYEEIYLMIFAEFREMYLKTNSSEKIANDVINNLNI